MKVKGICLLLVAIFCFLLVGCGEIKRPLDCPDSKWVCEKQSVSFSVSSDGKVTDGNIIDKNGNTVGISVGFGEDDKISITNIDETEVYITGTGTFEKNRFTLTLSDIYNTDLEIQTTRMDFKRA